jgi:hypothetical protein
MILFTNPGLKHPATAFQIDDVDLPLLSDWKLRVHIVRSTSGRLKKYIMASRYVSGRREQKLLHHLICGAPPAGLETDHRNGDGLDNRRVNLRHVDVSTNRRNKPRCGVSFDARRNLWRARTRVHGRERWLGYHATKEAAEAVYWAEQARLGVEAA